MSFIFKGEGNTNNDFIQLFVSSMSPYSAILESITYINNVFVCGYVVFMFRSKRKQCKQRIRVRCCWHRTANVVYVCDTLQNSAKGWRRDLNKVVIFVFFAHIKYSHSFVNLRLNHWRHLDYFNDLLATFIGLDRVMILTVYGLSALGMHQQYLNFWSEDEQRSYRFGTTREWVINDIILIFGCTIPLTVSLRFSP